MFKTYAENDLHISSMKNREDGISHLPGKLSLRFSPQMYQSRLHCTLIAVILKLRNMIKVTELFLQFLFSVSLHLRINKSSMTSHPYYEIRDHFKISLAIIKFTSIIV